MPKAPQVQHFTSPSRPSFHLTALIGGDACELVRKVLLACRRIASHRIAFRRSYSPVNRCKVRENLPRKGLASCTSSESRPDARRLTPQQGLERTSCYWLTTCLPSIAPTFCRARTGQTHRFGGQSQVGCSVGSRRRTLWNAELGSLCILCRSNLNLGDPRRACPAAALTTVDRVHRSALPTSRTRHIPIFMDLSDLAYVLQLSDELWWGSIFQTLQGRSVTNYISTAASNLKEAVSFSAEK